VIRLPLCAAALVVVALAGCGGEALPGQLGQPTPSATTQPQSPTPSAQQVEIRTSPEASPHKEAIAQGEGEVSWIESAAAGVGWSDLPQARKAVEDTIRAEADRLAAVDYPSLSLPNFITQTRAMKIEPSHFASGELYVDAYAEGKNGNRWALYVWRGPELPKDPAKPLVTRWIQVYALYDLQQERVTRLLATIAGQVLE
jgi:hypothetical protein